MKKIDYQNETCKCCGQSTTYVLGIDHGTVKIVQQIARFIGKKGINAVHPRKEMEGSYLTSNEVGNLSRARFHGLIARLKGEPGNYVLTTKGAKFLRGEAIPRYAIISKKEGGNIGYWHIEETSVVYDFNPKNPGMEEGEYWTGINYSIEEGRIINDINDF